MKPAKGGFLLQALWASLGQLFQAVLAFAGLLILVRLLGPEAYGIFAIALICVGFCEIVVGGHTGDGIVSIAELRASHTHSLFGLLATVGLAAGAGLWLAQDLLAQAFGVEQAGPVIAAASALPLLSAMTTVPAQLLARDVRFSVLSTGTGLGAVAAIGAGVYGALSGWGVFSLVFMEYVRRTVILLVAVYATRWRPGCDFHRADAWEITRPALGRVENRAVQYVSSEAMPRTLIGAVLGPDMLGIYVIAKRLLDQLNNVLSGPISAVSMPAFALARGNSEELRRIMSKAIRGSTLVFWPALIGLLIVSPTLLPLLFGEQLDGLVVVVQILIIASLRTPLSGFTSALFIGLGDQRTVSRLQWISLGIGAILLAIGLQYGLIGASLALAARQWLAWPFGASAISKSINLSATEQVRVFGQSALPSCLMGAAVGLASFLLPGDLSQIATLVCLSAIGVIVYPLCWMAVSPRERTIIPEVFHHIVHGRLRDALHCAKALVW
ncbi:MAG: oligosaccharide flippase family protein [Erythrobacter sp.]